MTTTPNQPDREREGYAPCSTCGQYSHSIGKDALNGALNHFRTMIAHPVRGHPMGNAFDAATRDAAQVLMTAALAFRDADRAGELGTAPNPQKTAIYDAKTAISAPSPATPLLDDETVERCAAVAEASLMHKRTAETIATAIRALKGSTRGLR